MYRSCSVLQRNFVSFSVLVPIPVHVATYMYIVSLLYNTCLYTTDLCFPYISFSHCFEYAYKHVCSSRIDHPIIVHDCAIVVHLECVLVVCAMILPLAYYKYYTLFNVLLQVTHIILR